MKIGISGGYRRYGDEAFKKLREFGFTHIDFNSLCNQTNPLYKGGTIEEVLSKDKMLIDAAGILVSQTHGPWDYHKDGDTPEQIKQMHDNMKVAIKATAYLGCKYMVVHPFFPHGEILDPTPDEDLDFNVKLFSELLPLLEEYDVTLCIENLPWKMASNALPERIVEMIEKLDNPHYAACLDTGHAMRCGIQPGDAAKTFGKYLKATHIHDNDGTGDHHEFPFSRRCKTDWSYFSECMKEIGFDGVFSLETDPKADLPDKVHDLSMEFLANLVSEIAKAAE